jgi:hypothetical protein
MCETEDIFEEMEACSAVIILTGRPVLSVKRWAWDTARSAWIVVRPAQIPVRIAKTGPHVSYGRSVERVRSAIVWKEWPAVKVKNNRKSGFPCGRLWSVVPKSGPRDPREVRCAWLCGIYPFVHRNLLVYLLLD